MNGIHEVTGSIPVWSTNLRPSETRAGYGWRAILRAKVVHRSCEAAKVDLKPSFGPRPFSLALPSRASHRDYASPPLPLNWSASSANSTLKLVSDP
jgi:hypothetical protein